MSVVKKATQRSLFATFALTLTVAFLCGLPAQTLAKPEGKIVIAASTSFEMTGADAHTATGATGTTVISLVHEGLTIKHADSQIYPALAKSWEIAEDWSKIEFTLDERAKFHDGTPVLAEDVKFSIERVMRTELKFVFGGEVKRNVDRVEIIDDHHVILHLKHAYPAFLGRTAKYLAIVPKHYVEKVGDAEFAQKPIGAGPFRCIDLKQDDFVLVEAVDEHYRKTANVKTILYKSVPENATRMAMLQTGEADVIMMATEHIPVIENAPDLRIHWSRNTYLITLAFYDLAFPDDPSPWHDIRVRKAAAYAINYELICRKVLNGASEPWGDILAPYHAGFDPTVEPYPYDPEKAKALLKEAGYPDGFETIITGPPPYKLGLEAVAANLKKVGIIAKLNIPEHGIWARQIHGKKFRGIGGHPGPWWVGRVHPAVAWESHLSNRSIWTYYNMPELSDALDELSGMTDPKEIAAQARGISKKYRENLVRTPLWTPSIPFGLGPRVKYWENVSGWVFPALFEYLELN